MTFRRWQVNVQSEKRAELMRAACETPSNRRLRFAILRLALGEWARLGVSGFGLIEG